MINGYEIGTSVKWNEHNALQNGIVEQVYREDGIIEINDAPVHIKVAQDSPTYLIRKVDGSLLVLPHRNVILKDATRHA